MLVKSRRLLHLAASLTMIRRPSITQAQTVLRAERPSISTGFDLRSNAPGEISAVTPTFRQSITVFVRKKTWSRTSNSAADSTFYWAEGSDESEDKQQREKTREETEDKKILDGEE